MANAITNASINHFCTLTDTNGEFSENYSCCQEARDFKLRRDKMNSCLKDKFHGTKYFVFVFKKDGDRGSTVVMVLRYKSEGRWYNPSWCHWNFSLT